jgi:hypothetical protein
MGCRLARDRGVDRRPTGAELTTFNVAYGVLIGANALVGTVWIIRRWRHYRAQGARAP